MKTQLGPEYQLRQLQAKFDSYRRTTSTRIAELQRQLELSEKEAKREPSEIERLLRTAESRVAQLEAKLQDEQRHSRALGKKVHAQSKELKRVSGSGAAATIADLQAKLFDANRIVEHYREQRSRVVRRSG